MKNFYMAVSVWVESIFTDDPGGNYAYMVKFTHNDDMKSVLERIGGLQYANLCHTKKEAQELVKAWNEAYKQNGTFVYDNPAF